MVTVKVDLLIISEAVVGTLVILISFIVGQREKIILNIETKGEKNLYIEIKGKYILHIGTKGKHLWLVIE